MDKNYTIPEEVEIVTKITEVYITEIEKSDFSKKEKDIMTIDFIKQTLTDYKELHKQEFDIKYNYYLSKADKAKRVK